MKLKLRFKGFSGAWVEKKLGDITKIKAGGTPNTEHSEYWGGTIRWMNSGELNLKQVFDVKNRITELGLKKSSTNIIPKYCILVGLAGQGKTRGTVAINHVELCTNQSIASIFPSQYYVSQFIYYNLDSRYQELRLLSGNSEGRGGLNLGHLNNLKVKLPTLAEQQKIADFLSLVDVKIEKMGTKIELLKTYKRGVLQQIFSQKLRFKKDNGSKFPDWEEKNLSDLCKIAKGRQLNKSNLTEISLEYPYPVINGGIEASGYYNNYNTEAYSITISEGGNSCGFVNLIKQKFWAGGHCYTLEILNHKLTDNFFLFQYLKKIESEIMKKRVGSGLPNIQKQAICDIKVDLPTLTEQQKIANFLTSLDQQIDLLTRQHALLIQQKKSYLSALL